MSSMSVEVSSVIYKMPETREEQLAFNDQQRMWRKESKEMDRKRNKAGYEKLMGMRYKGDNNGL